MLRLRKFLDRPADRCRRRSPGVITESKEGRRAILAKVVVDATGDGDLFAAAGEPFGLELVHPWLWFRMGNVRGSDAAILGTEGRFFKTLGGRFFKTLGAGRTLMPWGIADVVDRKIDLTALDDLTWAEIECRVEDGGRRRMKSVEFRGRVSRRLGVAARNYESRRLEGRYVLGRKDEGVSFHTLLPSQETVRYGVTTRSLPLSAAARTEQLLVAGRCIRRTTGHQATKEIPPCPRPGRPRGRGRPQRRERG